MQDKTSKYKSRKQFRVVMTVTAYNGEDQEIKFDKNYMMKALKNIIDSHGDLSCDYIEIKAID